jgi:hypothetical protein
MATPEMKMTKNVLQKFRDYFKKSKCINKPADLILDHRLADNLYLSLYEVEWEQKIKKSIPLAAYLLITNMLKLMVGISQQVMKGTYHEDHCFLP